MSEFIIASVSDADRFIQFDRLGKMCITNRREKAARFSDSGKAWRVLTTQMSKKKRDGWKVVAYEVEPAKVEEPPVNTTQRFRANIDTSAVSDEDFNWEKVRCNITESFSEIIAYKERLSAKLNQIEAELCDCEHACEFFKGYCICTRRCEVARLNGRKVLIKGNHDRVHGKIKNYFEEITDYKEITLPGNKHITLCHYPIVFFNRHHYGAFMFYGHVHKQVMFWNITLMQYRTRKY